METSITSKMVSQQTICGDTESLNIEITSDTERNLTQSKEKTECEQTEDNEQEKFILSTFHHREWLIQRPQSQGEL